MNRLQVLLCLIAVLVSAYGKPNESCKGSIFKINGVNYVKEVLKKDIYRADFLVYDRSTNSIFLACNTDKDHFLAISAKMNLNNNDFKTIDGIKLVSSLTVDAKTNDVYIAGEGGVYKYDKNNNKGELYIAHNVSRGAFMHMVYVKDVMYISGFPNLKVYKVENGEVSQFKELETTKVNNLVIDDNDNIYFVNNTALYRKKIGSEEVVCYENSEDVSPEGVAINKAGDVYAFSEYYGIYAVSKNTDEMVKVLEDTVFGLTFDGDNNMIYSDYSNLYRLKLNSDPNCE